MLKDFQWGRFATCGGFLTRQIRGRFRIGLQDTILPHFLLILFSAAAFADTTPQVKEEPVGLVLNPGGGKLLRADTETPLALRAGDLLFSGDSVRTEATAASYLYCPAKAIQTLSAAGEVRLDTKAPKIKTGKITEAPARACTLPQTLRVAVASQQHYGVTMTRGTNKLETAVTPRDQMAADLRAALAPLDAALAADAKDPAALVAMATIFEDRKLPSNALEAYYKLREQWPDSVWVKSKIFDLEQVAAAANSAQAAVGPGGSTYALLIGVSKYQKPELNLQFAHLDATDFGRMLSSPRGGGLLPANTLLLTDEKATTAAVRAGFQDFLKRRAGKNDTVVIVVAGHGTVETPGSKNAFILTYDADPQDLRSTALPMGELQDLFGEQLQRVGRVLLFVDVCKAGTIGTISNTTVSADVQHLGDVEGDLLGLLASRPKEVSQEGPQFGGGHGVFSYFVMKGLEGAADENKDGAVDASELISYVSAQVPQATNNKQHPREFGTYENTMRLSDLGKPGIDIARSTILWDSRTGDPVLLAAQTAQLPVQANAAMDALNQSIAAGRLLPDDNNSAFQALNNLQSLLNPDRYREAENQLRIALENRAQEVLLKYLAGDERPQSREDFAKATRYMTAARRLTQESLFLEGREDFFQGRTLLFDKRYPDAVDQLERAVRLDPGGAYGYNALGIAYLEQARFDQAIPAFRDAAKRAQHWSYPLHNLALSYVETGDYRGAIRAYQEAIRLTPQFSYLPYNLGLVYQRTNRRKEAEASYRRALTLSPNAPEAYNALGTLMASQNKRAEAEQFYRQALTKTGNLLPVRHNLGLLLTSDKTRQPEAIALFRANLQQSPGYLASRLSLAETLAASGDHAGAIAEYRIVLDGKPTYVAARLALAQSLEKSGNVEGALSELRQLTTGDTPYAPAWEQIGDMEAQRNRSAEARAAYSEATKLGTDSSTRKRIEKKLRGLK